MYTQIPSLELSSSHPGKGMVEYHVAYVGEFRKGDNPFTIDKARIDNWRDGINEMVAEGIEIPAPAEHNLDPAAIRAHVISARTGPDSKGRYSLWAVCGRFKDEQTYLDLKDSKVSLWAPEGEFKSPTTDKSWVEPIRHIAFTGHPVLPGLDSSKVLALSHTDCLTEAPTKAPDMKLTTKAKQVLKGIGIAFADDADEETILQSIEGFQPNTATNTDTNNPPKPEMELSDTITQQINSLRGMVLSGLVGVNITPAQLEKFQSQDLSKLSEKNFQALVDGLKLSQLPVGKRSQTPGQDAPTDGDNNLLKAVDRVVARTK